MNTRKLVEVDLSDNVYRAIINQEWFHNNVILRSAFTLRKNESYLSVDRLGERHQNVIFTKYLKTFHHVYGAAFLKVSDCIDAGVKVYEIGKKGDKYYSGIFYPDEPDVMMSIADDLAESAMFAEINVGITVIVK